MSEEEVTIAEQAERALAALPPPTVAETWARAFVDLQRAAEQLGHAMGEFLVTVARRP